VRPPAASTITLAAAVAVAAGAALGVGGAAAATGVSAADPITSAVVAAPRTAVRKAGMTGPLIDDSVSSVMCTQHPVVTERC
jgi:hypothetical protein